MKELQCVYLNQQEQIQSIKDNYECSLTEIRMVKVLQEKLQLVILIYIFT